MPVIRLAVQYDGTMSATVDGEPLAPPVDEGVWRRGSFCNHCRRERAAASDGATS